MWYPCVSTTCHISVMVTGTSFYDACYYTVSHLTCKILQNSFFSFHIYIYIFFSSIFIYFSVGPGKFSPNLFSIIFPSVIGIVKIYIQGSSDNQEFPNCNSLYIT